MAKTDPETVQSKWTASEYGALFFPVMCGFVGTVDAVVG